MSSNDQGLLLEALYSFEAAKFRRRGRGGSGEISLQKGDQVLPILASHRCWDGTELGLIAGTPGLVLLLSTSLIPKVRLTGVDDVAGWGQGYVVASGETGWFPLAFVEPLQTQDPTKGEKKSATWLMPGIYPLPPTCNYFAKVGFETTGNFRSLLMLSLVLPSS